MFVLVMFFVLALFYVAYVLQSESPVFKPIAAVFDISLLNRKEENAPKCSTNINVPCFENLDCNILCRENLVFCKDNFCKVGEIQDTEAGQCNPKHGIVAVFLGDVATGSTSWECISLYRYLFTDQDAVVKGVCEGGVFDVDLVMNEYRPEMCVCPRDKTLIWRDDDPFVLSIPRCVRYPELYHGFKREKTNQL